jgi:RNA polymerase sigma factor (sigma-70 family)
MGMVVAETDTRPCSGVSRTRENQGAMSTDGGAVQLTLGDRAALAVEAYRMGVTDPFTEVVTEITPVLWHLVRAQNVPRELAEDVVQGVWLAFVRNAATLRDPQGALKWLLVTARRAAWEAVRKHREAERRAEALPEDEVHGGPPSTEPGPEDALLLSERDRVLWRNVRALPERCQEIVRIMAFADRASYKDIAEATGMGVTSVGATRGRCLDKLRTLLASDEGWGSHG